MTERLSGLMAATWNALVRPRLGGREQAFFLKRLSFLLASGMPLPAGLGLIASEARGSERLVYGGVEARVAAGQTLAAALAAAGAWGALVPAAVDAGETSGRLPETLASLADELTKSRALRAKVLGALIYPAVIAALAATLVAVLVGYIFPKVLPLLSGLGVGLPWPTRAVIGASAFMRRWGAAISLIAATAALGTAALLRRNRKARLLFDSALLRTPVMGPLLKEWQLASGSRMLGGLVRSGLPVPPASRACARAAGNLAYQDAYEALADTVERGGRMSESLAAHPGLFSSIATGMVLVGEASGTLPETLEALAAFYDAETDERARRLSALVEPVVMLSMGLVIGFVAVAIIAPIYALTGHLHA
jgi:type II secretory pathway component PulF